MEVRGRRLGSKPLDVDLVLLVGSILLHEALMTLVPGQPRSSAPVTDKVFTVEWWQMALKALVPLPHRA